MYLNNISIKLRAILFLIVLVIIRPAFTKDNNAQEIYYSCENYFQWVNNNYSMPVDEKVLFNMGKCQGVIETLGKTMLTLCYENRRNANINKKLAANLEGVKTINIIEKFLKKASSDGKLRSYSSYSYLINFISQQWPCK